MCLENKREATLLSTRANQISLYLKQFYNSDVIENVQHIFELSVVSIHSENVSVHFKILKISIPHLYVMISIQNVCKFLLDNL